VDKAHHLCRLEDAPAVCSEQLPQLWSHRVARVGQEERAKGVCAQAHCSIDPCATGAGGCLVERLSSLTSEPSSINRRGSRSLRRSKHFPPYTSKKLHAERTRTDPVAASGCLPEGRASSHLAAAVPSGLPQYLAVRTTARRVPLAHPCPCSTVRCYALL
jgi:hypothetical protein